VTVGSTNTGKGIVLAFTGEGSNVVIADRDEAHARGVATEAMQAGPRHRILE